MSFIKKKQHFEQKAENFSRDSPLSGDA